MTIIIAPSDTMNNVSSSKNKTPVSSNNEKPISSAPLSVPPTAITSPLLELDPSLFKPTPDEVDFFKTMTGIQDFEELKDHILRVQKEAYEVRHSSHGL